MKNIDDIYAREQEATPGPWIATKMTSHKSRRYGSTYYKVVDNNGNDVCYYIKNAKIAELIAHAPEDIFRLVNEAKKANDEITHLTARVKRLEAENATYREAEQDGWPCKLGDMVYWISRFRSGINQGNVMAIKISAFGFDLEIQNRQTNQLIKREFEKVFLTREDAEAALSQQKK